MAKMSGRSVGYPEELLDIAALEEFFDLDFDVEPDEFFENAVKMKRWWMKTRYHGMLRKRLITNDWKDPQNGAPARVNAYYIRDEFSVFLPAGLLQELTAFQNIT